VPDAFTLDIMVRIKPQLNTALSGLYTSGGNFCTQCEAEGFRRITYFLDRPDVSARYWVRIVADKARYPVLLSNGNPAKRGDRWTAAFRHLGRSAPEAVYLFALVAGDLVALATASPPARAARSRWRSGCGAATRTNAPTRWRR
jgi:aminopeptidase N